MAPIPTDQQATKSQGILSDAAAADERRARTQLGPVGAAGVLSEQAATDEAAARESIENRD